MVLYCTVLSYLLSFTEVLPTSSRLRKGVMGGQSNVRFPLNQSSLHRIVCQVRRYCTVLYCTVLYYALTVGFFRLPSTPPRHHHHDLLGATLTLGPAGSPMVNREWTGDVGEDNNPAQMA
jgi:hypothetical protein